MENTRNQQIAADALVTAAVLALGAALVVAGNALAGEVAPGASGDWLRIAPGVLDGADAPTLDVLLGLVASLVGLAVVVWWLLSAALAMTAALLAAAGAQGAARRAGAFAPAFMRRLAMAILGLSLMAAPAAHADGLPDPAWHPTAAAAHSVPAFEPAAAGESHGPTLPGDHPLMPMTPTPASAAASAPSAPTTHGPANQVRLSQSEGPQGPVSGNPVTQTGVPQAAWVPTAPPASPGPLVQQPTRAVAAPSASTGRQVEVRPGDSLWTIVARDLGPGATDLDIAAAWPDWYEANAGVIGQSPDLIRPGQLLVPPR